MASLSLPLQLRCSAFTPLPACQPPDSSARSAFLPCLHARECMHAYVHVRACVCVRAVPRQTSSRRRPGGWQERVAHPPTVASASGDGNLRMLRSRRRRRRRRFPPYLFLCLWSKRPRRVTAVPCWCFSFNRQAQSWPAAKLPLPLPQLRLASGFFAFHPHRPRCVPKKEHPCVPRTHDGTALPLHCD